MATATKQGKKKVAPAVQVTLGLFDTRDPVLRLPRTGIEIGDFHPLTITDYAPSGGTPLRDATARMIGQLDSTRGSGHVTIGLLLDESGSMGHNREAVVEGVNQFVDGMRDVKSVDPESAGKVLCVVVTDGEENSSTEVDPETLRAMIAEREKDGWTFIFLGANIDAWDEGRKYGYSGGVTGQTVNYTSSPVGTRSAMASVTTDSSAFLANNASYASMRASSSSRTIAEDGTETIAGSPQSSAPPVTPYGSVDDALRRARKATS